MKIELNDEELETIIESLGIARDYWNEESAIAFSEDMEGLALPFAQNRLRKTLELELKLEKSMKTLELTDEERRWLFYELTTIKDYVTRKLSYNTLVDFTKYEKMILEENIRICKSILEKL